MTAELASLPWLLESAIPTIRYLALTRLAGRAEDDPQAAEARRAIRESGPAPAILAGQSADGHWQTDRSFYTPKYVSSHWAMTLLAELGLDETDEGFRRGAQFMLADTVSRLERRQTDHVADWECFWGNLVRYSAQAGLAGEPGFAAIVEYLVWCGREGGWACTNCHGPCAWGAARALWGLAAVPDKERYPGLSEALASGERVLLAEMNAALAGAPTGGDPLSPFWLKLNFPLFYQADVLFGLRALAGLGALDGLRPPAARPALDWLAAQRAKNGRFAGAGPFRTRTYPAMGSPEETRRWATLFAEMVIHK
jgi:hypothetical protein